MDHTTDKPDEVKPRQDMSGGSAVNRVYGYIGDALRSGAFAPGTFITESEVATALGVSRTPVREAIRRLTAERLVSFVPGRGAFVRPVTRNEVRELSAVRELIETHAVSVIIDSPPAKLAEQLDASLRAQSAGGLTPQAFIEEDRNFHQTIVTATGNTLLDELYNMLRDRQVIAGLQAIATEERRLEVVVEEHRAIAEAIRSGDEQSAVDATRRHLTNTLEAILANM